MASMRFDVVTLFPEMIQQASDFGIVGRAIDNQLVDLVTWNPRDFTEDRHRTVDARPYGGGPGMVMMYQPLQDAIDNTINYIDNEMVTTFDQRATDLTAEAVIEENVPIIPTFLSAIMKPLASSVS